VDHKFTAYVASKKQLVNPTKLTEQKCDFLHRSMLGFQVAVVQDYKASTEWQDADYNDCYYYIKANIRQW